MTEKYCFTVGNEGQASLNILEKSFNDQTQYFLNKHGLRSGLSIPIQLEGTGFIV